MIYYKMGGMKVFKMQGSVFPSAISAALPCATIAAAVRFSINKGYLDFLEANQSILTQTQAWTGFSVLVGFLIIFRSSQAYSRFWDGCTAIHHLRADWFDAASALISFTETSKAPKEEIAVFKHTLVRLVSMMHSAVLLDLEEMNNKWGTVSDVKADGYELLDPVGIDEDSLNTLYQSKERVMLIYQWIQLLIIHNMDSGVLSVPPPILSRAYQELANGMVAFHECVKISGTPFPFPYAQNCELLLCLHWILIPIVVSQWVTQAFWAFVFVFMQVFVLWSLNYIAVEIENPFGTDENDVDGVHMQEEMNRHLLLLLDPRTLRRPTIAKRAVFSLNPQDLKWGDAKYKSFKDVWQRQEKRLASCAAGGEARDSSAEVSPGWGAGGAREARRGAPAEAKAPAGSWAITITEAPAEPAGKAVGDSCLRREAQAQRSSPRGKLPAPAEPGPEPGGSWAIDIREGKCEDKDKAKASPCPDRGRQHDRGPPANHDLPALNGGRWEALPSKAGQPPQGQGHRAAEDASSGSEEEGSSRQAGGRRSGSRKRQQHRGKRRWL